jgi:hypothetical protein
VFQGKTEFLRGALLHPILRANGTGPEAVNLFGLRATG